MFFVLLSALACAAYGEADADAFNYAPPVGAYPYGYGGYGHVGNYHYLGKRDADADAAYGYAPYPYGFYGNVGHYYGNVGGYRALGKRDADADAVYYHSAPVAYAPRYGYRSYGYYY